MPLVVSSSKRVAVAQWVRHTRGPVFGSRWCQQGAFIRKDIRPQTLLRPVLILYMKNHATPRFVTEYHRASKL